MTRSADASKAIISMAAESQEKSPTEGAMSKDSGERLSRSQHKRIAIQKGEPMPDRFDAEGSPVRVTNDAIPSDVDLARGFWERFYALSPFQTDRPHEDVTIPLVLP